MEMSAHDHKWYETICRCRQSGLTDRQWCLEQGVSLSTFYRHARRLRQQACSLPAAARKGKLLSIQEVVPLQVIDTLPDSNIMSLTDTSSFQVRQQSPKTAISRQADSCPATDAAIRVELPGSIRIDIASHTEAALIFGIIRTLRETC